MLNLNDRSWKEFFIGNLFEVKKPKPRSEKQYLQGMIPFIASGNTNNGVIKCCTPRNEENTDKGNCITVSPVDGSAFFQEFNFLGRGGAGSSILLLYNSNLNRYSGLFITRMIRQTCSKYCYGKMGNQENIKREKIMLPVDGDGNPDYAFMEQYIKEREKLLVERYKKYMDKITYTGGGIGRYNSVEWKEFLIEDICDIESGRDIYDAERGAGNTPYITSTAQNNGIKYFVNNNNNTLEANCISVNRNGSVGYSFYHKYRALYSNDCRKLRLKRHNNEFVALFITNQIMQQRYKYNYSIKMGTERLKKQKIVLPVDGDGSPDYAFMEQYIRYLEYKLLQKYLAYLNAKYIGSENL